LIDVRELKRSLAAQIVRTHLKVTGRDQRLSPLAINLAFQAGMAIADSYVVEIVKADALIDLLKNARTETFAGTRIGVQSWGTPNLRNLGRLLSSEYRGRNFYVSVPLSAEEQDSYRLRLRLSQWQWKLAGVDLPEAVVLRLVQEFRARGGIR